MYSADDTPKGWVAPFGYPRIKACSRLPMAFRSVPRPSSPPGAKASTECPSHTPSQTSVIDRQTPTPTHGHYTKDHHQVSAHPRRTLSHVFTQHFTNAPEHCHRNRLDDPSMHSRTPRNPFRSDSHLPRQRTTAIQAPPKLSPEHDPTELSYAPRDAPEPDSQHKRTRHRTGPRPAASRRQYEPTPRSRGQDRHHRSRKSILSVKPANQHPDGDYRIRTDDPLLAKQVLYQLS